MYRVSGCESSASRCKQKKLVLARPTLSVTPGICLRFAHFYRGRKTDFASGVFGPRRRGMFWRWKALDFARCEFLFIGGRWWNIFYDVCSLVLELYIIYAKFQGFFSRSREKGNCWNFRRPKNMKIHVWGFFFRIFGFPGAEKKILEIFEWKPVLNPRLHRVIFIFSIKAIVNFISTNTNFFLLFGWTNN